MNKIENYVSKFDKDTKARILYITEYFVNLTVYLGKEEIFRKAVGTPDWILVKDTYEMVKVD